MWYDFNNTLKTPISNDTSIRDVINFDDVDETVAMVLALIEEEMLSLPNSDPGRIIVGGFSQGGVMSLATLLSYKGNRPLGGVISLSCFQALDKKLTNIDIVNVQKTPLFKYHGKSDNMVPLKMAEKSMKFLTSKIYTGDYKKNYTFITEDGLKHFISPKETDHMR